MREAVPTSYSRPNHKPATPITNNMTAAPKSCGFFIRKIAYPLLKFSSLRLDVCQFVVFTPSFDIFGE